MLRMCAVWHARAMGTTRGEHAREEVREFARGDVRMVYTRSGAGPDAIVLVHGIGMGHRVFRDLAEALGERAVVYAVDLPGFGDSPEPGSAHSMEVTGDLISAFVAELGLRDPLLVGHSMGTQVVVEAVVRHPETSDRIVLVAPTVNRAERTARRQALRMLQDLAGEHPKVLLLGLVHYVKAGPRWFLRKLRIMLDHDVEERYPLVRARALVIRGEDDRVVPRDWIESVVAALPSATLVEVPERGHEAMIRSAIPVAETILRFAAENPPRR